MRLSDITTSCIVRLRDGNNYYVCDKIIGNATLKTLYGTDDNSYGGHIDLTDDSVKDGAYKEDLTEREDFTKYDIMAVKYMNCQNQAIRAVISGKEITDWDWQREVKLVTTEIDLLDVVKKLLEMEYDTFGKIKTVIK